MRRRRDGRFRRWVSDGARPLNQFTDVALQMLGPSTGSRGIVGQGRSFVEAAKHYPALKKQWVEFLGEHPNAATEWEETTEVQAA